MMERFTQGLFFLSLAFLVFLTGAVVAMGEIFPYAHLNHAYRAGVALYRQQTEYATPYRTDLWHEARTEARGVTEHDPERAAGGYTLFTSGDGPYARLIDMEGNVVHEWRGRFSSINDGQSPIAAPRPDEFVYMRKAEVLPNGDLLAIYIASGDTPWGYGMVRLDRDSNPLWFYPGRTHHDFDVAPDGGIYALTHEFVPAGPSRHLEDPFLDDFLVVLSPEGEEQRKISLTRAMAESRYAMLLGIIPHFATADPLHTNSVERLDRDQAAGIPGATEGDVLLSFRELSVIAVLSVEQERIVWATRGPWMQQHDARVLPNGHIMLFDNLGGFRENNASRILEIDPRSHEAVWRYEAPPTSPLDTVIRGAVERLDNGNVLITEANGGRLVEVTPEGETVWEYVNPVRGGEDGRYIPTLSWGQRVQPTQFATAFRDRLGPDIAQRREKRLVE